MNSRSGPPREFPLTTRQLLPWLLLAAAVLGGVFLAFRYGQRITPLIDAIR